ncbi:ABC transporter substrate-binding protein [Porphyromonas loveana]|uniref:Amino acid/amide ABC transporter substrate-binding protein (HAAT family) n=1 Tax=Porphyromonas loveana TaxID=1884669 RepID=A0A2U1FKV3_9PORP|nr:ABC transporter substrate-binding protein [Porphyromonas loveana]PVZ12811.1 amino acid/amide ABC transporter substrate-binding protein (HAAT family) [Porphyromonas loveana]
MKKNNFISLALSAFILLIAIMVIFYPKANKIEKVTIDVICDQTGAIAEYGQWVQKGVAIASEKIKEKDPNFEIHFEDGQSNVNKAINAFERITSTSKTKMVICGCNSSSVMSLSPKANSTKTLLFSTIASSPNMKETSEFVFSNRVLGIKEVEAISNNLEKLGITSIAIVAHNNEAGMPYIEAFSSANKNNHAQILSKTLIDPNSKDFRTELIKLKKLNPKAVLLITPTEQSINFIKQSESLNFTPIWIGISSLKTDDFIKNGGELVNNMIIASESTDETNQQYIDFENRYKKKYHERPTIYAINGFEATIILHSLIQKFGNDVNAVKQALYSEKFETLSGTVSFDSNGIIQNKKVDLYTINNGHFIKI